MADDKAVEYNVTQKKAAKKPTEPPKEQPALNEKTIVEDAVVIQEGGKKKQMAATQKPKAAPIITPAKNAAARPAVLPLVFGGIGAGLIGFAVAFFATSDRGPFRADTTAVDQLTSDNVTLMAEISTLKSEISALNQTVSNAASTSVVDGLGNRLGGRLDQADILAGNQSEALTVLASRITDIENRPIPDVGATAEAVATYERELIAMRQMFAGELVRIEAAQVASAKAQTDAAIQSDSTAKQMALTAVQKAVDDGESFADPLTDLRNAGIEIPEVLTQAAKDGVPTLAALQDQFPEMARSALDASIRADADAGTGNRVTAFFRTQLGARSLAPKEGDDPDAILSRAEAAIHQGDIARAVLETAALPGAGAAKMADWVTQAQSRQAVVDGLAELTATLGF